MDFFDIDEVDENRDFVFFLEEKSHDEISNILEQWKDNNPRFISSLQETDENISEHQRTKLMINDQQQQCLTAVSSSPPSGYKLDSRTFTRSKRRSVRPFETQSVNQNDIGANAILEFSSDFKQQYQITKNKTNINSSAMPENIALNMEIGGLVTTMPPPSTFSQNVISSMTTDGSIGGMSNSLITSADFTNINFLQSTSSLDFNGISNTIKRINNNNNNNIANNNRDAYNDYNATSVSDFKVLDSLTMSGDGTLIKDTHIGQIDDISLPLSRTASGCTTMNNSTESMECPNFKNFPIITSSLNSKMLIGNVMASKDNHNYSTLSRSTMALNEENIGEITCALVENSICNGMPYSADMGEVTINQLKIMDITCLNKNDCDADELNRNNSIIEQKQQNRTFEDKHCETPEHEEKVNSTKISQIYESTPQVSNVRYRDTAMRFRESPQTMNNMNISPIYMTNNSHTIIETPTSTNTGINGNVTRVLLNDTMPDCENSLNDMQNGTYLVDLNSFNSHLPDKQNQTFNASTNNDSNSELNVLSTAVMIPETNPKLPIIDDNKLNDTMNISNIHDEKTDVLLKTHQNEEEFEHMLNEFSRVELNAEQKIKMKKSLESLKKRFHHRKETVPSNNDPIANNAEEDNYYIGDRHQKETNHNNINSNNMLTGIATNLSNSSDPNHDKEIVNNTSLSNENTSSPLHQMNSTKTLNTWMNENNSGERLLNRRSRLYDNVFQSSTAVTTTANTTRIGMMSSPKQKIMNETINIEVDENEFDDLQMQIVANPEFICTRLDEIPDNNNEEDTRNNIAVNENREESNIENNVETSNIIKTSLTSTSTLAYHQIEKRIRERDRFKTIKIYKTHDQCTPPDIDSERATQVMNDGDDAGTMDDKIEFDSNAINNKEDQWGNDDGLRVTTTIEAIPAAASTNITSKSNINYLTYRKSKHSRMQLNDQNFMDQTTPEEQIQQQPSIEPESLSNTTITTTTAAFNQRKIGIQQKSSLAKPHYNNTALKRIDTFNKANSADNLMRTTTTSANKTTTTQKVSLNSLKYASTNSSVRMNENRGNTTSNTTVVVSEVTSLGFKSKSFNNLANNNSMCGNGIKRNNPNVAVGVPGTPSGSGLRPTSSSQTFGFRKPNLKTKNVTNLPSTTGLSNDLNNASIKQNQTMALPQAMASKGIFKVPRPISSVRGLTISNTTSRPSSMPTPISDRKTGGLQRPSSGYFSLHTMGRNQQQNISDLEIDNGRHSSTDSMSSSSSKNSAQGSYLYKPLNPKPITTKSITVATTSTTKAATKPTDNVTSSNIAKPSGLRPPSTIKRSGLPRPQTVIKTVK